MIAIGSFRTDKKYLNSGVKCPETVFHYKQKQQIQMSSNFLCLSSNYILFPIDTQEGILS